MANDERIKKTFEEINKAILEKLNEGPQTAQDIALGISSNWKTVKDYLKELVEEGKVKEVVATENVSYYKRTSGDTYFDLPISEEERNKFRTLFYLIKEGYKKKNKELNRTHLAKCAVHLIKEDDFGELKNLPVVWYLYGALPQMVLSVADEASEDYSFIEKQKIEKSISLYVLKNGDKSAKQLQKEQHENYGQKIYCLIDDLSDELNKESLDNQKINGLLNEFFIECPVDPKFPEIFDLSEEVISVMGKLILLKEDLGKYRKQILITLDALWKFIALYYLYKSKIEGDNRMDKKILLNFYLGEALEDRKRVLGESFSELRGVYLEVLTKTDLSQINLSEGAKEVARIMEDFI